MKVKQQDQSLENVFGAGGNIEIVPLLVPMQTYQIILQRATEEGCTPADVLQKALYNYLINSNKSSIPKQSLPTPVVTIRRRK